MKKFRAILIVVILLSLLLVAGWLLFQWQNVPSIQADLNDFRYWFWHTRSLDLVVQVLLVFAGALAIAAILPFEEPND